MIRFKDYTVDLGGNYPGKQRAVIDHAAFLGWDKREIVKSEQVCRIQESQVGITKNSS